MVSELQKPQWVKMLYIIYQQGYISPAVIDEYYRSINTFFFSILMTFLNFVLFCYFKVINIKLVQHFKAKPEIRSTFWEL